MSVLVKNFLALPILKKARLVAGAAGVDRREIHWFAVIEWPVERFVRPGEMVLTSGVGCDTKMFARLVHDIIESRAGGLCVGVGPKRYIEAIPESVKSLADKRRFPLIELPWALRFSDITKAVVDLIIADRYAQLDATGAVPGEFWATILDGLGFQGIAEALERLIRRAIIVLGADFRLLAVSNKARAMLGETGLARCRQAGNGLSGEDRKRLSQIMYGRNPHQFAGLPPLHLGPGVAAAAVVNRRILGYLYALEDADVEPALGMETHFIEQALSAVTIEALRQRAACEAEAKLRGDFIWALATGWRDELSEIHSRAAFLGYDSQLSYQVMVVELSTNPREMSPARGAGNVGNIEEALRRVARGLGVKITVAGRDGRLLILIESRDEDVPRKLAEQVRRELAVVGPIPMTCGIACTPRPLSELTAAYSEASDAVEIGRLIIGPECVAHARDLGPFLMLKRLGKDEQARQIAMRVLERLINYDRKTGRNLRRTLEVYLEERGNTSAAARRLFLNRHSLLYRLKKIEMLTGRSLDRYSDFFVLDLSLKLLQFGVIPKSPSSS
jgi:PucR family transcriptional regulator, purine catabolism regulatory protein